MRFFCGTFSGDFSPANVAVLAFFGTFAGVFSPAFVVVLVVLWNICRENSGICCCFGWFLEHLPGIAENCIKSKII